MPRLPGLTSDVTALLRPVRGLFRAPWVVVTPPTTISAPPAPAHINLPVHPSRDEQQRSHVHGCCFRMQRWRCRLYTLTQSLRLRWRKWRLVCSRAPIWATGSSSRSGWASVTFLRPGCVSHYNRLGVRRASSTVHLHSPWRYSPSVRPQIGRLAVLGPLSAGFTP